MKFHCELIKIITSDYSAFCRVYSFNDLGSIRQVMSFKVSAFDSEKSKIVAQGVEFAVCEIKENKLFIRNLFETEVIIKLDSARTTSFNSHLSEEKDVRAKTSILIKGTLDAGQEFIINIENRKLKGIIK